MPQPVTLMKLKLNGSMKNLTRPSITNNQKRCSCHYRGLESKSRSQEIPGVKANLALEYRMKQGKANRVLLREHTSHIKQPLPTTQEKTTHVHHQTVSTEIRMIIFFAAKDREALYSQQKQRLGANCGSDHELLIAKFRLKLKKVGKTTRPFKDDLNQIPYNYTVEVTNRFKELDLIECLKNYGWRYI